MIHLFLRTKKFIPNEFHQSFFDINFAQLYKSGYRLILTDLDNTLISYDDHTPTKEITNKFAELKALGFELKLISNNVTERIETFIKGTDLEGVANARKPLLIGMKRAFKASAVTDKSEVIIVGDQLMTDVWAANRFNAYSILVNPIKKKTERWYTRFNRRIESKMLLKIQKHYPNRFKKLNLDERV
jgi:hypothetical protein